MWLDYITARCLWNLSVEATIVVTPTTPVLLILHSLSFVSHQKGSASRWHTKHRTWTFPYKSHKCIDSSHFFLLCLSWHVNKTVQIPSVFRLKVFWGCLEKCWIHFSKFPWHKGYQAVWVCQVGDRSYTTRQETLVYWEPDWQKQTDNAKLLSFGYLKAMQLLRLMFCVYGLCFLKNILWVWILLIRN